LGAALGFLWQMERVVEKESVIFGGGALCGDLLQGRGYVRDCVMGWGLFG
jgi:hypothetical protein